jgi:hypothetical protein
MIGDGEGQPRDDDIRKRITGHVHAHPKTIGPEENAARRCSKLFEQFSPRRTLPLDEQIHPAPSKERLHLFGELLHSAIAREKNKGASVRFRHEMLDPMRECFCVT